MRFSCKPRGITHLFREINVCHFLSVRLQAVSLHLQGFPSAVRQAQGSISHLAEPRGSEGSCRARRSGPGVDTDRRSTDLVAETGERGALLSEGTEGRSSCFALCTLAGDWPERRGSGVCSSPIAALLLRCQHRAPVGPPPAAPRRRPRQRGPRCRGAQSLF